MGRSISLKVGDKVIAAHDFNPSIKERGIIIKPWGRKDNIYDWWVEIHFKSEGKDYQSQIPYRESELRVINDLK